MVMEDLWKEMSLPAATFYHLHLQRHPDSYPSPSANILVSASVPPPPLPPTALSLSLSSTLEFTYLGAGASNSSSGDDSRGDPFAGDIFSFATGSGRKLGAGDRRHRRMMKNRESAARSRARKQAYTSELELALGQLQREKEMLVKRHQELNVRLAMAAPQVHTAGQRCRSAPPGLDLSLGESEQ